MRWLNTLPKRTCFMPASVRRSLLSTMPKTHCSPSTSRKDIVLSVLTIAPMGRPKRILPPGEGLIVTSSVCPLVTESVVYREQKVLSTTSHSLSECNSRGLKCRTRIPQSSCLLLTTLVRLHSFSDLYCELTTMSGAVLANTTCKVDKTERRQTLAKCLRDCRGDNGSTQTTANKME